MSTRSPDQYRPQLCAFVDILGFSELVEGIPTKPETFDHLLKVLDDLKAWTESKKHDDDGICYHDRRITVFSDSIVISYPVFGPNPTQSLCKDLVWLARRLLEQGILTRGAVAVGSLYHNDGIVFGTAFLEAYRLEREIAIYPRIIVQDAVLEAGKWPKDAPAFHSQLSDVDEPISSERDFDGVRFLNPLRIGSWSVDFLRSPAAFLKTVREEILTRHLDAERKKRANVLVKLAWLANHFNAALQQAKRYQDQLRNGQIVSNYPLLNAREDFCGIEEIDWQRWTLLPLSENAELTRWMFGEPSREEGKPV